MLFGDAKGNRAVLDLPLGAKKALSHRRFRDEEGPRHIFAAEATEEAKRQGDLGFLRKGWVTAGEDQPQLIITQRAQWVGGSWSGRGGRQRLREKRASQRITPQSIDGSVARRADQPGFGMLRRRLVVPLLNSESEGVLECVLRKVDIAEDADKYGEGASPTASEELFEIVPLHARLSPSSGRRRGAAQWLGDACRDLSGPGESRIEVGGLDDIEAGEVLLGLGRRGRR